MSVLDIQVSLFKSVSEPNNPTQINLLEWLKNDIHKGTIQKMRNLSENDYKKNKKQLPCITPSGLFNFRKEKELIEHSGLIQFDIDCKDNQCSMKRLKELITQIPYVAYCGYSLSKNGLWGLMPIEYPDKHKYHFKAMEKAFKKAGVIIDKAPSNVASLRFVSYDAEPFFNHNPEIFSHVVHDIKHRSSQLNNNRKVEELVSKIQSSQIDITEGYENWMKVGFSFSEEFGESGRNYFHQVSQWHQEYKMIETDIQYDNCLKSKGAGISIASFFYLCQEHGVHLNSFSTGHAGRKDKALEGEFDEAQESLYGINPYTGEIFDERGYPSDWDSV